MWRRKRINKKCAFYYIVPFILENYDIIANEVNSNSNVFSHFSVSSVLCEGLLCAYFYFMSRT